MPSTISFTPSWPPRLMICSSAGIAASAPSSPKRLVPRKRTPAEFLEAFRFDQLVQDRALAFGREGDFLVRPFDAPLQPILLLGIGDVHELIADAPAIGALQQIDHLARRGGGKAQHAVDEDGLVQFGGVEAVERRDRAAASAGFGLSFSGSRSAARCPITR